MPKSYSIRGRLNLLFVVIVTVLLGAMAAVQHVRGQAEREAALHAELDAIVARLAGSLPAALWNFDQGQIDRIVAAEMGARFIESIVVLQDKKLAGGMARGADGKPAKLASEPAAGESSARAALVYDDAGQTKELGAVVVHVSYAGIRQAMRDALVQQAVQAAVLAAALVAALSLSLARVVLKPLDQVRRALEDIGAGSADLTRRLPTTGSTEFVGIAHGFNAFIERLERVVKQVRQQADSVALGSKEIAAGNLDLSQRTEETASQLQAITQTMSQLRQSVAVNAEGADTADRCGREAADVARRGGTLMDEVVRTMGEISASARRITEIINVIDGIAFQTNILALNAAVEAARAGDQGRGFAVVAGEVRSLAKRSADAAREIKQLIGDAVEKVAGGQTQVDTAGQTIREIVLAIGNVSHVLGEITVASQQQREGIGQVSDAIGGIDEATQRNAALVEEVSAAAGSVRESTAGLVSAVGVFEVSPA